jgi:hypothetical protein
LSGLGLLDGGEEVGAELVGVYAVGLEGLEERGVAGGRGRRGFVGIRGRRSRRIGRGGVVVLKNSRDGVFDDLVGVGGGIGRLRGLEGAGDGGLELIEVGAATAAVVMMVAMSALGGL